MEIKNIYDDYSKLKKDILEDIPREIRQDLKFKFVKDIDEVLKIALKNGKV